MLCCTIINGLRFAVHLKTLKKKNKTNKTQQQQQQQKKEKQVALKDAKTVYKQL